MCCLLVKFSDNRICYKLGYLLQPDTAPALLRQAVAGRVLPGGTRCPQPVAARVAALPPNIAPSAIPLPSSQHFDSKSAGPIHLA